MKDGGDDSDDAHDHDDALNKVIDGGGHVAPGNDIDSREHRHNNDAHRVVNVEGHAEQAGQSIVQAGGIGDEKDKNDDRGGDFQRFGAKSPAKNSGMVALSRCCVIMRVRRPSTAQASREPRMALPMPAQVAATPYFQPNCPA